MKKIKLVASVLTLVLCFALSGSAVMAQIDIGGTLSETGTGIYGGAEKPSGEDLPVIIGNIINVVLGFLGVILVVVIIYGGFLYMTAGGDDGKVKTGKAWIINGIIGLIIILLAYAITTFVINRLIVATGTGGGATLAQ